MTLLKLCGTTNEEDARLAQRAGADYCGVLVEVDWSERSLSLEDAARVAQASGIAAVALLCNPTAAFAARVAQTLRPHALQLLCRETPALVTRLKAELTCQIWKTVHLPRVEGQASPSDYAAAGADALLVDSVDAREGFARLGGTGLVGDWSRAARIIREVDAPVFLAGGINAENVAHAVRKVRPYGIDLCSGVESERGRRDPSKVMTLMRQFRRASAPSG